MCIEAQFKATNKITSYGFSQMHDRLECDIAAQAIMNFLDRDNETDEATHPQPTDTALFAWSIARNVALAMPDHIRMAMERTERNVDHNSW